MRATERVRNDVVHQEFLVRGLFWTTLTLHHNWVPFVREHFRHMWE